MTNYSIINVLSFLSFIQFFLVSILEINRKKKFKRYLFLIALVLTLLSYSFFTYTLLRNHDSNYLSIILYLTLLIILIIYLLCSIIDFSFIRLRLFFIPYFFFFIILCNLSFYLSNNSNFSNLSLFEDKLLSFHIIISLLSYSFLTVSSISSTAVLFQERNLKKMFKKIDILDFLPSIYEGEKITIRLLVTTQFFLLLSLLTGFYYHESSLFDESFFTNEKFLLSIITFLLICILLFIRYFFGLTGKKIFSFVLLSFLFINVAYFGLKIID